MTNEDEFRLEEYKSLRTELVEQIKEAYALEKYVLAGVFGSLIWLATNGLSYAGSIRGVAWTMPLIFVLLGLLRSLGLLSRMMSIASHLKRTEEDFTKRGYEADLRNEASRFLRLSLWSPKWRKANWPSVVSITLWLLLMVGTGVTAEQCALGKPADWCRAPPAA